MRRIGDSLIVAFVTLFSCATFPTARPGPSINGVYVIGDDSAQMLFNDALAWSRANSLETGGCFSIFSRVRDKLFVDDAVETVIYRRPLKVGIPCKKNEGLWHTHWLPESDTTVQCDLQNAKDLYLIGPDHPLGLVICGVGRDSVIPYVYVASKKPAVIVAEPADTFYRCIDEPLRSLRRPKHRCGEIPPIRIGR